MNKKLRLVIELAIVTLIIAFIFNMVVRCGQEKKSLNNGVISSEKTKIFDYKKTIDSLELEILENNKQVLELQNRLQVSETDFLKYKKTQKYKEKIVEIIKTIPIDTLASNTIELEHCVETSHIKDTIINDLQNSVNLFKIEKEKYRNIIVSQLNIESQLNENLLFEINKTKKANRNATYWKIGTGILGGFLIYDKIIK